MCGDGVKEGGESCDDGNTIAGDGCGADCRSEPACTGTMGCTSPCGDGLKLPERGLRRRQHRLRRWLLGGLQAGAELGLQGRGRRDDGHLVVPVVYRDFLRSDDPNGHPNFGAGTSSRVVTGMVQATLAADRKPLMTDSAAGELVPDHLGRLRPVVPRLGARQAWSWTA